MQVRVYNYNTMEKVKTFEAHSDYIRCIAVHPTLSLLLTSSDDMTIRLWDWEKAWGNTMTFEGHSHYVMMVAFNPKDANTFASASLDRTIKVWGLNTLQPHFTLEGHEKGVNCVLHAPLLDGAFSGAAAADFYGGRLALRRALGAAAAAPILKSAGGAPDLPRGVLGSISHKRPLAVAVARPRTGGDVAAALGVDVERAAEPSVGGERLARRVLAAGDRAAYDALSGAVDDGARAALFFSLKEAVYKAVAADAPRARFRDVALAPGADGSCAVAAADGLLPAGASVDAAWRLVEHDGAPYFLSTAVSYTHLTLPTILLV